MPSYNPRTNAHRAGDFPKSKQFEQMVGSWLPATKKDQTSSKSEMDWLVDDIRVEVKEKNQKYNANNWPFPRGTLEKNVFIIDELSIFKALHYFPSVYFVLHDNVNEGAERVFLAPISHIVACEREMVDRVGPTGYPKGKWLCNITQFMRLDNPAEQLWDEILKYEEAKPWLKSACLLPTH